VYRVVPAEEGESVERVVLVDEDGRGETKGEEGERDR